MRPHLGACAGRCGTRVRFVAGPDGKGFAVELVADDGGDVAMAGDVAYRLDADGTWKGQHPPAGAVRYVAHRCPVADAAATARAAVDASNRAVLSGTTGPCTRCRRLHERYGPNGRPLCVDCAGRRSESA